MEPICKGRGSGSNWRGHGFNSAPILTGFHGQKASNFCHDRTTIGPRSCVDRDPGALSIIVGSSRIDSAAKGVRSRSSSTTSLHRPMAIRGS